jgi:predicted DNA-binding transcriptional regulator AlpA
MSRSFLRQARMEGNRDNRTSAPPFIKIGRSVRYLREDLDQWLNQFNRLQHLGQAL